MNIDQLKRIRAIVEQHGTEDYIGTAINHQANKQELFWIDLQIKSQQLNEAPMHPTAEELHVMWSKATGYSSVTTMSSLKQFYHMLTGREVKNEQG